ncbi:transcriptional regulator [Scheffersomyces amazonensis]|uniref:transcriptional regulator n=1 Tax=Scheffersomyces amazonensis TaxID=1078765 RepID=UPI00315CD0A0
MVKREINDESTIPSNSDVSITPTTLSDTTLFSSANIHNYPPVSSIDSTSMSKDGSSSISSISQFPPTPNVNSSTLAENKRRRVTRACDNCRQKKVKCDGKQPCIHCTVYSFKCTYDQPNIRNKKNSGIPIPAQPSATVLAAAAAAAAASNSTLSSDMFPNRNLIACQNIINTLLPKLKLNVFDLNFNFDVERFQRAHQYVDSKHGTQSLNEISELYLEPTSMSSPIAINSHDRQSSVSSNDDLSLGKEIKLYLPSKEIALQLIYTTWNKACVLFRFYHRPSLLEEVDLLYSLDPYNYGDRQQKFLPFLYSILACGSLFSKTNDNSSPSHNENLEDEGFKYFLEARKLIDISNVGDINSIQTIVMMIMYLQCSARLSTCYSYIGIALRSALKEGLHRNLSIFQNSRRKLDPIEVDTRKRLFYTIYKMDIYINSLLGLPRSLNEDEFDQELPTELDDENITRNEYLSDKQEGRLSSSGCANQHTKLMLILSHIVKKLYPIKVKQNNTPLLTTDSIHVKVTELELELKTWLDNLPAELKPTDPNDYNVGNNIPERYLLANYYLHLAFLNCQIMLYRPFIHFISDGGGVQTNSQNSDPRSLIRGRNCIKVARLVVKLADKMIAKNLLVGTYWFSMYTIFFSIACLIYYFHFANYHNNNPNNPNFQSGANYVGVLFDDDLNIDMIKKDIEVGRRLLDHLKNSSSASTRIYNILNTLFEQLNRRTANSSRFRTNILSQSPSSATPGKSESTPGNAAIKSTFVNFDKINKFDTNNKPPTAQDFGAYARDKNQSLGQLFTDASLATFEASSLANKTSQGRKGSGSGISFLKTETPEQTAELIGNTSSESQSLPLIDDEQQQTGQNATSNNRDDFKSNYMPGPFDKLDAQIFGRILPPYMLEKNAERSSSTSGGGGGVTTTQVSDSNVSTNPPQIPGPLGEPAGQLSNLNLDSFDFSSLGDPNNLDFLDPYSSVYSDFKG